MINLKDKLKEVVNHFKKEPIAVSEGFKRLEKVKRAAVKTGQDIQVERLRSARKEE